MVNEPLTIAGYIIGGMTSFWLMFIVLGVASVFGLILSLTEPKQRRAATPEIATGLRGALAGLGDVL